MLVSDLYPFLETSCNNRGSSAGSSYGNGLIQFIEKSFCSNGVCNDVTVCQTVDYHGEAKYYVPLRDIEANRHMKELVINETQNVNQILV